MSVLLSAVMFEWLAARALPRILIPRPESGLLGVCWSSASVVNVSSCAFAWSSCAAVVGCCSGYIAVVSTGGCHIAD